MSAIRHWSLYSMSNGLFTGVQIGVAAGMDEQQEKEFIESNTPHNCGAMFGRHDNLSRRVDLTTRTVIDYQPAQPSALHEWNTTAKRWQLSAKAVADLSARDEVRTRIDSLWEVERHLMRRLILDPTHKDSRARLAAVDAEITRLRSDLPDT